MRRYVASKKKNTPPAAEGVNGSARDACVDRVHGFGNVNFMSIGNGMGMAGG